MLMAGGHAGNRRFPGLNTFFTIRSMLWKFRETIKKCPKNFEVMHGVMPDMQASHPDQLVSMG
jgi:hypothetical protein